MIGVLTVFYLAAYFVLMDRHSPAMDIGSKAAFVKFDSSARLAPRDLGHPTVTPINYVYYPLDVLYFSAFPSHRKYGEKRTLKHIELASPSRSH